MKPDEIQTHHVPWQQIVIVCAKCTRKLDGGFGKKRKHTLRSFLRRALRDAGRRREVRVVETECFGLCPKHAVTMVTSRAPGELVAIPEGTASETVLQRLGVPPPGAR